MADYNLEALTLSELKNMPKDVAEAISIFEDRRKVEARPKVEAFAHDLGTLGPNLSAPRRNPPVRLQRRNTDTLRTCRLPEGGKFVRCNGEICLRDPSQDQAGRRFHGWCLL
jgi:hypothetical protein